MDVGSLTPNLSANALKVLAKRYLAKNEKGEVVENPEQLFRRVAKNLAQADRLYEPNADLNSTEDEFYRVMAELRFLPNSPTLMNAGRDLQQLSACFVLPVEDSMESIFETVKNAAIIHKSGGGTGFSFSRLRPREDVVRTTGGVASGPVSFMKVFNHATEAVKQGGTRRGANMGILRVDHPDIFEFIDCKNDLKEITNFNISVAVTDRFMEAFEKDEEYELINPRNREVVGRLRAREVMDRIAENAWGTGEPGLFFIDVTNRTNPTPHVGEMEATNPCGEQPLLPYESCNLGSINLEKHMREQSGRWEVDWDALEKTIRCCVHLLDNVIDMNAYPIPEIERITKSNRKIGLGVMGFARMLFKLEIPYDSERGIEMGRTVMRFIKEIGYDESARVAQKRGVYAFWKGSLHEKRGEPIRNSYVTTVAPTGTISMIADTSGGCEPEFSLIWFKNVMGGDHLPYTLDYFFETAKREGFWNADLPAKVLANNGSVRGIAGIPKRWQEVFAVSFDVTPQWHVRMQAAFQEYSDSAVSKTINLPQHATISDVKDAYLLAYRLGCKGITVYRDGARADQVLNVGESKKGAASTPSEPAMVGGAQSGVGNGHGNGGSKTQVTFQQPAPAVARLETRAPYDATAAASVPSAGLSNISSDPGQWQPITIVPCSRPETTSGRTTRTMTSCGKAYTTINDIRPGVPIEMFSVLGKSGGCEASFHEAIGRLVSLCMRSGIPVVEIEKQLIGIRCDKPYGIGVGRVNSCADLFGQVLRDYRVSVGQESDFQEIRKMNFPCPDCGCSLIYAEGCEKCTNCSYTRCG